MTSVKKTLQHWLKEVFKKMQVWTSVVTSLVLKWLKDFVPELIHALAVQLAEEGWQVLNKIEGKFLPVGGTIFGRRFAIYFSTSATPPSEHPRAIHLGQVTTPAVAGFATTIHLWLVSFSKDAFAQLPASKLVQIRLH